MKKTDVLIIGGGVTGLSLASYLSKRDYLILEKDSELGGYCKTEIRGDYVWDYSGHFFHFKNEEIKNYVLENVECDLLEVEKITDIYYNHQIIDFPFQHNIHQLSTVEYSQCLEDLEKCKEVDNSTFKSYVKSSLGAAICDKFVIPYNEKLYACNLDELESDSMGRFFPKMISYNELQESKKSKSYNDTFIYPTGGSYEYIKSILKRVDESKIQLNTTILSIDYDTKIATTNSGEKIQFENLVSTISFKNLLKLSNRKFDNLSSNKVAVFNLGFDKGTPIKTHWRYFPGSEIFYRVGFYNNILAHEKMSLYVEIGLSETQLIDEGALLMQVLADLEDSGIIKDGIHELVTHQFLIMNPAYVHITKESKQLYNSWCLDYNKLGIYSIGRYGSWTYCSIEDNIVDAKNLANVLENQK